MNDQCLSEFWMVSGQFIFKGTSSFIFDAVDIQVACIEDEKFGSAHDLQLVRDCASEYLLGKVGGPVQMRVQSDDLVRI